MAHYHRFSGNLLRLQGYDYRNEGWYFITICTKDRICHFGEVINKTMQLSDMGQIAHDYWLEIPNHWPHILLEEFIIMPNHMHGIIGINYRNIPNPISPLDSTAPVGPLDSNGPTPIHPTSNNDNTQNKNLYMSQLSPKKYSLSRVIGTYKAACTHMIRRMTDMPFAWQTRFHDHIIRNQRAFQHIENYIKANPEKWKDDTFFST